MPAGLQVTNLSKIFDNTIALQDVSFEVSKGDIIALLGPSGCGKSTTLSIIAGLVVADRGDVYWDSQPLEGIPPHQRNFGLMFQDLALFPHLNVAENIAFSLHIANWTKDRQQSRVKEVLQLVGLPGYDQRDVNSLSGGEQQRVALARSLAPSPKLLMLDEPLGALDRNLRERLILELQHILKSMHQTSIYVTHDQEEAFTIADRVVIMNAGKVEQAGTPQSVYRNPASIFSARFLGLENIIPAEAFPVDGETTLDLPFGKIHTIQKFRGKGYAVLRPDEVEISEAGPCKLSGIVMQRSFRGNMCRAVIQVGELRLVFNFLSNACVPDEGEKVTISYNPNAALQFFPTEA